MSEQETATFETGYRQLEVELANGTPAPVTRPKSLSLERIHLLEAVFQPRGGGKMGESEDHIRTLMEAAMHEPKNVLDPITVWWSGSRWLVLDGHHRLKAYRRLRSKKKGRKSIPVSAFAGHWSKAVLESNRLNAKDKLPMSKDDKLDRAWQLVILENQFSKREIAETCRVGRNTVSRMRKVLKDYQDQYPETWREVAFGDSWKEALRGDKVPEWSDEKEQKLVEQTAFRLAKTFGKQPAKQPDIFFRGLQLYSEALAAEAVRYFRESDCERLPDFDDEYGLFDDDEEEEVVCDF